MADLGNLFFSLGLDTKQIDTAWDAALKKYGQKAQVDLKLNTGDLKTIKAQYAELNAKNKLAQDAEYRGKLNTLKLDRERLKTEELINTQKARTQAVHDRTTAAVHRTNAALNTQHRFIQNINTMAASYLSLFAVGRLTRELVTITGEFELQKVALQAILGDLQGANKIFDQIKQLAVKSPFQFKDLVSYTKQLSAFSVPLNELYDTTKMLADVSAGLGVGMDRLVLAYGQIRAASVLRGQEVRQLTEAGIPVIEELRKKFEELGETGLTAADVFDKISARLVPFSMIKDMFTDMTSEGGKFYQMQEIQAETLKGKVSNLVDAYQIMFAEIGEKGDGVLKGSVDTLRYLMDNYEEVGKLVMELVAAYGVYKGALITTNTLTLLQTKYGLYDIATKKLQVAATLKAVSAQGALNAVMAINPYVAAAAAIAVLSYGIYKIVTHTTEYEKSLESLMDTQEKVQAEYIKEEFELSKLYDRLKNATKGSKDYLDAKNAIERKYGSYLSGLKDEKGNVIELADAYQNLADKIKESAFQRGYQTFMDEATNDYSKVIAKQVMNMDSAIQKAIKNKVMTTKEGALISGELTSVLTGKKNLSELSAAAAELYRRLAEVSNGAVQYAVAQTSTANTNIKKLSEQAKRLLGSPMSPDGGEYPEAPSWLRGDKWLQNLGRYSTQYGEALQSAMMPKEDESTSAFLERLREDYAETAKSIAVNSQFAGKDISALRDRLAALAGAFRVLGISPDPKTDEKQIKKEETAERKLTKLRNREYLEQLRLEAEVLRAQQDSTQKRLALAENEFRQKIALLDQERLKKLDLIREAGGDDSELTGADLTEDINSRKLAETEYNNSKIEINRDAAQEIQDIWQEVIDFNLSGYEKEIAAVNKKFDEESKRLRQLYTDQKQLATALAALEDVKNKKIAQIEYDRQQKNLDTELEMEYALNEKKTIGLNRQAKIEEKNYQAWVRIMKAKVKMAIENAKEEDQANAAVWQAQLDAADTNRKEEEKARRDALQNIDKIGGMLDTILQQSSNEFVRSIGSAIGSITQGISQLQTAAKGDNFGKASSIIGIITAANQMVSQARAEAANPELQKQKKITNEISNRINFELQINKILEERGELTQEDIFNIQNSTKVIDDSVDAIFRQSVALEKTMRQLATSTIFGAEGTGKRRLFGSKTGNYEFSLADILKGIAPKDGNKPILGINEVVDYKGQGGLENFLSVLVDPADILQGRYADTNARKDAFLNLQKTVKEALKAMGKSVSDFATMSTDDLLTFFTLMESAGSITDEGTKKLLAVAKEQVELAKKAIEDMKKAFSDIVGDLGSSLSNSLANAFVNGSVYGAIDAFHKKVGDVISDIVEQMVFAATLQPFFTKAQAGFMASYGLNPDGTPMTDLTLKKPDGTPVVDNSIVDDLEQLDKDITAGVSNYEKALQEADARLKSRGYAGITGDETDASKSTLGGAIQASITENTANLLGGYINGIRADGAKRTMLAEQMLPLVSNINDTMGNGLAHLAAISSNTFRSAVSGEAILEKLNALTSPSGATRLNAVIKTN